MADREIHDSLVSLPQLTPRDLLEMEEALCRNLATVFSFTAHALYFPTGSTPPAARLLPRERRLLLPLTSGGRLLGVFMARGVRPREIRPLLSVLPGMAALCLANLAFAKAARTDAVTSFATEDALFARIEQRAARVRGFLEDTAATGGAALHSLCFGLVLIRLANGENIARQTDDYVFENDFLRELARTCADILPPDALPARVGRYEFALLLPGAGRAVCENTARTALGRMQTVCLPDPLSLRFIRPVLCAGYAVYPQDMQGADMVKPMYDQARRLLARAFLATDVAQDMILDMAQDMAVSRRILAFARILHEGGVAREILGGGRVLVSLGRRAGAAEGMRFAVHARKSRAYKGEIVLLQSGPLDSVAEILHVADVSDPPVPGDILAPLGAVPDIGQARKGYAAAAVNAEGVCGYGDFLKRSVREMGKSGRFVLAIARFEKAESRVFAEAAQGLRGLVLQKSPKNDAARSFICGEYGDTGLIFFHSGASAEAMLPAYESLCSALKDYGPAAGLAGYPFLHYNKAEIRDCALKALEYARLLPEPRAGVCNSLALNISADRFYSLGDLFSAVEEYKLALLADKNNVMALNSLGVCMAALGRRENANRYFLAALKHGGPLEGQTCYNLGAVNQTLGKRRAAVHYYRRCLVCAPDHLFAHIRLGQLYEAGGRTRLARAFYERSIALEDARQQAGPARRLLAGLMARGRRHGEARELLQDALTRNPDDAAAMLGLANLYLNGDESPELAEMFARRSLGIHDRPEARQTLARALRVLNREGEARSLEAAAG
ncbi:MAG: diguanylate cyclase [Desulfovibrio sp.]|jgi:tetratricopeptide (TPR) repeat protein/GGDEF domain-containing protein|nr:diguanylate cyclase [Desulfovibrio sp.]